MSQIRYLIAVALPFFLSGFYPRTLSAQQPRETVEIHGQVLYPNGKVASGALVAASIEGNFSGRIPSGKSDDHGRFIIKGLKSGVRYDVCASKQNEGHLDPYFLPLGLSTGGQCKKITAGVSSEVNVLLAPKGGTLEGDVRDARSLSTISSGKVIVYRPLKFLRGEWVLVNPRDATWVPSVETGIGSNGRFKIVGLPTGRYFLKVEVQGHSPWYFSNQLSDTAAQPIVIRGGLTRKIIVNVP